MRDRDAAQADSRGHSGAAADQDVAARNHYRLHDAVARPLVLPEQFAIGRGDARRAFSIQQKDLSDAVDRRELWRAVASFVSRALPARIAGCDVVGSEHAGGRDDDSVANNQRRACKSPHWDFRLGIRCRVARPDDGAITSVERVQDSRRAKCVDAPVAQARRCARTGASIRFVEPSRIAMSPHRLASG